MLLSILMVVDIETIPDTEHHEGDRSYESAQKLRTLLGWPRLVAPDA